MAIIQPRRNNTKVKKLVLTQGFLGLFMSIEEARRHIEAVQGTPLIPPRSVRILSIRKVPVPKTAIPYLP
jgi:hypothetical protein